MGPTVSLSTRGVLEGQALSCLVPAPSLPFTLGTPTLCTQATPASHQGLSVCHVPSTSGPLHMLLMLGTVPHSSSSH